MGFQELMNDSHITSKSLYCSFTVVKQRADSRWLRKEQNGGGRKGGRGRRGEADRIRRKQLDDNIVFKFYNVFHATEAVLRQMLQR